MSLFFYYLGLSTVFYWESLIAVCVLEAGAIANLVVDPLPGTQELIREPHSCHKPLFLTIPGLQY
jgi:hypothetical protein